MPGATSGHFRTCARYPPWLMSYTDAQVAAATAAMEKHRGTETGEVGAALTKAS